MNDLIPTTATTLATMSSREIADLVESRHDKVKQSIDRLADRGAIRVPPMGNYEYINNLGIKCIGKEYLICKRDSYVIVAQLSPEFTARLVDRWQALETQVADPVFKIPKTLSEALLLAGNIAAKNEVLEAQAVIDTPKAKAMDRLEGAAGSLCITDAAKALKVQPKDLFDRLVGMKWIYRRPGGKFWLGYQDKVQAGYLEHRVTTVTQNDGSERVIEQTLVTSKGIAKLAKSHNAESPGLPFLQLVV